MLNPTNRIYMGKDIYGKFAKTDYIPRLQRKKTLITFFKIEIWQVSESYTNEIKLKIS